MTGMVTASMMLEDQGRVAHARHAAGGADIGRDAFQRHDGHGAGLLGDAGVLGGDNVHDDPALEHLRQTGLQGKSTDFLLHSILLGSAGRGDFRGAAARPRPC